MFEIVKAIVLLLMWIFAVCLVVGALIYVPAILIYRLSQGNTIYEAWAEVVRWLDLKRSARDGPTAFYFGLLVSVGFALFAIIYLILHRFPLSL